MIRGLHHACLSTHDFDRLLRFYTEVVGCEETWVGDLEGDVLDEMTGAPKARMRCALLRLGGDFIEVQQYLSPPAQSMGEPRDRFQYHVGLSHICLDVVDIDAEHERLLASGVRFVGAPREIEGIAKITFARDPDGNLIELQEILVADHPLQRE